MLIPRTPLGIRIVIPRCNYAYTQDTTRYRQSYTNNKSWLVGKVVDWLVGLSVDWLVGRSVGLFVGWFVRPKYNFACLEAC